MKYILKLQFLFLFFLISCQNNQIKQELKLRPASFSVLENWNESPKLEALIAFKRGCSKIMQTKKVSHSGYLNFAANYQEWENVCNLSMLVDEIDEKEIQDFFEENFMVHKVTDLDQDLGLFTGYYEIIINASLKKDETFKYPIYKMPPKWLFDKKKPFFTRKEIENGSLNNIGLEIIYTDDPVKLYFLHIQGSGIAFLKEGGRLNIGYAGKNGHQYGSIGKYLIEQGVVDKEEMSAKKIMQWLENCNECFSKLQEINPSYVFFRVNNLRAIGTHGVELIPERSLAVDTKFIPLGLPVWLETNITYGPNKTEVKMFNQLMIAQDSGGAIKGPIRGDIFFGSGEMAENMASYTKNLGQYYLLIPKDMKLNEPITILQ